MTPEFQGRVLTCMKTDFTSEDSSIWKTKAKTGRGWKCDALVVMCSCKTNDCKKINGLKQHLLSYIWVEWDEVKNSSRAQWNSLSLIHDVWGLSLMVAGIIWRFIYSHGQKLVLAAGRDPRMNDWLEHLYMASSSGLGHNIVAELPGQLLRKTETERQTR